MKKHKIDLEQEQLEKLQELGSYLHETRTQQGISIRTVANRTRIQGRLLQAIEEGNLKALPEPIYIRELIKKFAHTLDLDGIELASSFPTGSYLLKTKNFHWYNLPSVHLRPFHLYFLYIFVVIVSVRGLSTVVSNSALEVSNLENVEQSSLQTQSPKPSVKKVSNPLPASKKSPIKPVVVEIKLKDQCWLRVVADGKTEFEGVLPEGSHRTWVANERLTVRAGNAGGVLVAFNDEQAKQLGAPGQVQEITYKK